MSNTDRRSHTQVSALFASASNHMHASVDIAEMLQVGVLTATQLVHAKAGTAALLIDGRLAFSEYLQEMVWHPLQCRFGSEVSWVGDLIAHQTAFIMTDPDEIKGFDEQTGHCLPQAEELAVVPVIGKNHELLACLLLFAKTGQTFEGSDTLLLQQLASMMSVAIENGIQQSANRRVEADLEKSVATYRTLVEQIPAITYIATLDRSRILFVSPQVEDILGYRQDDFLANQQIWSQQIHPDDRERVLNEVRQSLKDNIPFHAEYRICSKDGRDIWVKDAAATVRDHDHDLYLQGVVYDISERKVYEKKLMMMAHFDHLTGLANRALFHDRLGQIIAQSKRHDKKFAVLYLDLDGFKAVNDQLGHQAGDDLLVKAGHRLQAQVREVDTVARMGGDEFTIILEDIHSHATVELVANKLVEAIAAPYEHIGPELSVSMSMGIAIYPDDSTSAEILVTAADNAMYRAKQSGKNRHCFHQGSD
ncbi:MAG: GGDEF domain-containing protein [Zetaproteobacteria bacterium CG12_big_fil_rev_8_21_14_0_65_54_13]|nr:MAG: GGDEF domain-containing protein [Zetaproteobacteria bacterium CG23_combo_of_CG06-09_8_20_14_all_54_7]PIW47388.1 MAG: GGDEF domain-containing protein [Zetaproteobacteria bacterium CG12_big_fil_rev_8_21_14_0_65_54_13]PIX55163.1 MAG: GGDEF domain-containing protein [Zetaproteobacteria bacterium CG_4_10_14_3_um_filter_54_28]PJA30037.1 MAG: GGDEF domain-containing protein [Zetaproteobacteria bacterium CG_4_9_14_3_um_filter_54_145]